VFAALEEFARRGGRRAGACEASLVGTIRKIHEEQDASEERDDERQHYAEDLR
jgi:hypothetical protein